MSHYSVPGMLQALNEYYQVLFPSQLLCFFKSLLIYFLYVHADARRQLFGVGSLFPPPCRFWRLNAGQQACVTSTFTCRAISFIEWVDRTQVPPHCPVPCHSRPISYSHDPFLTTRDMQGNCNLILQSAFIFALLAT